jgi:bacillolysin
MMVDRTLSLAKKHAGRAVASALVLAAGLGGALSARAANPVDTAVAAITTATGGHATLTRAPNTGLVTFLSVEPGYEIAVAGADAKARAAAFLGTYGAAFGVSAGSVALVEQGQDELAMDHVRYQELYKGVPVTGAELSIHLRGTGVAAVNARTALLGVASVAGAVSEQAATNSSRSLVMKRYNVTTVSTTAPRLEFFVPLVMGGPQRAPRLAWFVEVYTPTLREFVWIDARRGGILLNFSQLPDALSRQVHDAAGGSVLPGALARSEGEDPVAGAEVNAAYDYAGDFYNYFSTEHGRDSYDGKGAALVSAARYCPTGDSCSYLRAFWDGRAGQAVFGQGMAADDIVAHELTHALVEKSARLFGYRQSGALNESFADLFGELVDLGNGSGNDAPSQRWLIGEDLPGGAVRNMTDPGAFSQPAWTGDANYYCGADDNGGVHVNAGVLNHAFALMADGGSYRGVSVASIGLQKTGKIAYRALTRYLTSASNLLDGDQALRQSCADLVGTAGITSDDCAAVGSALDSVDLGGGVCAVLADAPACGTGLGPVNWRFDGFEAVGPNGTWGANQSVGGNAWLGGEGVPAVYFSDFAKTGWYSLWGRDLPAASDSSVAMASPTSVPAGGRLEIRHYYAFEPNRDGGVVEYSANNGAWQDAQALRFAGADYDATVLSATGGNPLAGRRAFTGFSGNYVATQYDLSSLEGQNLRVRFRIGTDQSVGYEGWFIDDVRIYSCDTGGTFQMSAAAVSVAEATPEVKLTVTRDVTTGAAGGVVLHYATNDLTGTATAGQDYTSRSGMLTFDSWVKSGSFSVPILNDTVEDAGETFDVELSVVPGGPDANVGTPASTAVTIINDDHAGKAQFSAASYSVEERAGYADLWLSRNGAASGATVDYRTVGATATAGSDYGTEGDFSEVRGTLTFAAGQNLARIRIPVINDCLAEGAEYLNVIIENPGGGLTLGARTNVRLSIVSDDVGGVLDLSSGPFNALEAALDAGGTLVPGAVKVYVVRSGGAACGVTVNYATSNGTAIAGEDYDAAGGTLTFAKGETTKTVVVSLRDDTLGEGTETFNITLSNPQGGAKLGAWTTSVCSIYDDEVSVAFDKDMFRVKENVGWGYFTVKRRGPQTGTVTVQYEVGDGTAILGQDYVMATGAPTVGTLTFGPNVTLSGVAVRIVNNLTIEPREEFTIRLFNVVGGVMGTRDTTVVAIDDDDTGGYFDFDTLGFIVKESVGSANACVSRHDGTGGGASVEYYTADSNNPPLATPGLDYTPVEGTLSFGPGETRKCVAIPITNDVVREGKEEFFVRLRNGVGAVLPNNRKVRFGIVDDTEDVIDFLTRKPTGQEANTGPAMLVRMGDPNQTVYAEYYTSDGTAVHGVDYYAQRGVAVFRPGVITQSIAIQHINDAVSEPNKVYYIHIGKVWSPDSTNWQAAPDAVAEMQFTDDDEPGWFTLTASEYVGTEGATAKITVKRLSGWADKVKLQIDVSGGTATPCLAPCETKEGDYVSYFPYTMTFNGAEKTKTIAVPINQNTLVEGLKWADITLTPVTYNATVQHGAAKLYIKDNDAPAFRFTSQAGTELRTYSVVESAGPASIAVTRTAATTEATVEYDVAAGTATAGADFVAAHGVLTFAVGQLSQSFDVQIVGDDVYEPTETILLSLSNPSAGHVLTYPHIADLNILNDDPGVVIETVEPVYAGTEGGQAAVQVIRSNGVSGSVTVHYSTSAGTATAGVTPGDGGDYQESEGTLTFGVGETTKTIYIPLLADSEVEPGETFTVTLDTPGGAAVLGPRYKSLVWIADNN